MKRVTKVLVLAVALILSLSICSIVLATTTTVEGQGNYFVTGESYPTSIQMAGYNSRDKKLYMNLDLKTTKTVGSTQTASFHYFIEVFDGGGGVLGTAGSFDIPETVSGIAGADTATVTNKEVVLANVLTAAYRTVITVKEVVVQ